MIHFVVHDEGDSVGCGGRHPDLREINMRDTGDKTLECKLRTANGRLTAE